MNRSEPGRRAVVVGGGLAGTAAAVRLADLGWDVLLLESRSRLGGAAYSFDRDGTTVDTGQHVMLRCYTEYLALARRMGVTHRLRQQDRLDIPVVRPGAATARIRRGRYGPAPLHLAPGIARYRPLPVRARVSASVAANRLRRLDPDDPRTDEETFGAWLRRHRQCGPATAYLWRLLCVAALNIAPEEASLALAARVLRTGLLDGVSTGDIVTPRVPLSALHDGPARALLARLGVRCHTRERVTAVSCDGDGRDRGDGGHGDGGGFTVRTASGEIAADAVVLAVPHRHASRLAPRDAAPDAGKWRGLGSSPIVNVHVRYDRQVAPVGFAAALDSPVQWVFDRTEAAGGDGQYLVVSLSAADDEVRQPAAQLLAAQSAALADLFPAAREARVVDAFVTREPRATFRQRAGTAALRPPTATRRPGLVLAGAWTRTGWPDTLEGAVRSGEAAADHLDAPTPWASSQARSRASQAMEGT